MVSAIIFWVIAIIAVEAITEIIVFSEFFAPLREFIFNTRFVFMHKLFACGYCMSVWVSVGVSWFIPWPIQSVVGYLLTLFVIHRLSNLFHELCVRWLNRIKINDQINKSTEVYEPQNTSKTQVINE